MTKQNQVPVLVFGQICLDIMPDLGRLPAEMLTSEGRLFEIGAMGMRAGGGVGNTGTALLRLGADAHCAALIGNDAIGQLTISAMENASEKPIPGIQTREGQASSYTLVLAPANHDRTLLYSPGVNDEFSTDIITDEMLDSAGIVHCAYPTVLRQLLLDGGASLARLFRSAQARGAVTSIDLTVPDPMALSGSINWQDWLHTVLPHTDIFVPSIDEAAVILGTDGAYEPEKGDPTFPTIDLVNDFCRQFLNMGVHIAGVKLGRRGLMLATSADAQRRLSALNQHSDQWAEVTVMQRAFDVSVNAAGTTGAGDCAYAGLLAAIAAGSTPQHAIKLAAAAGAACVESPLGAASLPSLMELDSRIASGWQIRLSE